MVCDLITLLIMEVASSMVLNASIYSVVYDLSQTIIQEMTLVLHHLRTMVKRDETLANLTTRYPALSFEARGREFKV